MPHINYTVTPVTDTISRITMPGDVFSYLVTGKDRAFLIDTGFGIRGYRDFIESQLNGLPYELILTHGHFDHSGGASEFETVKMNMRDLAIAREHTGKQLRLNFLKQHLPDITLEDVTEPMEDGYLPLEYGETFSTGSDQLEIVCLQGHTPGSIGILFRKERILLAGDACCSFTLMFGNGQSTSIREYRQGLIDLWNRYQSDFETVLYSHPHNHGEKEIIPQMIQLCDDVLSGRDARIERTDLFGRKSYVARAVDEDGNQPDGRIANLMYSEQCL